MCLKALSSKASLPLTFLRCTRATLNLNTSLHYLSPACSSSPPVPAYLLKPVATPVVAQNPTRFWGVVELDADSATMDFSKMTAEVIQHFSVQYGVTVKITVEIEASSSNGLDVSVQRTVKENCGVWKFRLADLESH